MPEDTTTQGQEGDSGKNSTTTTQTLQTVPYAEYQQLKSKYDGQSGFLTQVKGQLEEAKSQIAALTGEYEEKVTTVSAERDTLTSQLAEIQSSFEQAQARLTALEHHQEVGGVIQEKFPGLAKAHSKGLLRTDGLEGEELESYLQNWNEMLSATADDAANQLLDGATPPTPTGTDKGGMTAQQLEDQLMTMDPNDPNYSKVETEWMEKLRAQRQ